MSYLKYTFKKSLKIQNQFTSHRPSVPFHQPPPFFLRKVE